MNAKNTITFEPACFYLRKSREDQEAEQRGEGETLAKHRNALIKLAKEYKVTIEKIFEEVVSGESVIHRPQMLELLKEVEIGKWKSVFCMDIDRLGRGGMRDQGLILDTFKTASTLIVTPRKVYDLNDEWDEEYTEFEAFMARKELKIITRRMQSGRRRSVEEGNFLGSTPPYGYKPYKDENRRYLIKNPEQSESIKLIFSLYTEKFGASKVANYLNNLGLKSATGLPWSQSSVMAILKNPVYAGVITWGKKKIIKNSTKLNKSVESRPKNEQIWTYNAHEPYISLEKFNEVQEMLSHKYHVPYRTKLTNPLAGLIICADCGKRMVYRPYTNRPSYIICYDTQCKNKSSRYEFVEAELLRIMALWLEEYRSQLKNVANEDTLSSLSLEKKSLKNLQKEQLDLEKQKDRLHDLLEQGIYDTAMFLERSQKLTAKSADMESQIKNLELSLQKANELRIAKKNIVPKIERVLKTYQLIDDAESKNSLLKSIIDHATYKKESTQKMDEFSLTLYPCVLDDHEDR